MSFLKWEKLIYRNKRNIVKKNMYRVLFITIYAQIYKFLYAQMQPKWKHQKHVQFLACKNYTDQKYNQ